MDIYFSERFISEYQLLFYSQHSITEKIDKLVDSVELNPFEGIGKPERLKGNQNNCYSRRITKKDRLVYKIENDEIIFISCKGHYE